MENRTIYSQNIAVIAAGGLGTRLKPLTPAIPKALVPIANMPLLGHAIMECEDAGIDEILILCRRDQYSILRYIETIKPIRSSQYQKLNWRLGRTATFGNIKLMSGCNEKLGLGGKLLKLRKYINRPFALLFVDELFLKDPSPLPYLMETYQRFQATTIAEKRPDNSTMVARVSGFARKTSQTSKSHSSFVGRAVCSPEIFDTNGMDLKKGEAIDVMSLIANLAKKDRLISCGTNSEVFDCGTLESYAKSFVRAAATESKIYD